MFRRMTKKEKKSETFVMDLPEIDYSSNEDRAILRGNYMWETILIYYYWESWHPCAYLKVNKIPTDIEMLDVPCHWGITFYNEITEDTEWNRGRFEEWLRIGWDYAHWGDYMRILWSWKKWTTEEILSQIRDVIIWCKTMWMI